jgi:hypothetical protein
MGKTLSNGILIFLASVAFLSICCVFTALLPGGGGSTPTPASINTVVIYKEAIAVRDSSLPTPTYTFTPTAINAKTPSRTPLPEPTGTPVTPFLLPTKVATSTFAYVYIPPPDYNHSNTYDYPPLPDTSDSGAGASALCRDGTYSYSAHRRGTCSHHGGVAVWLANLPP